MRGSTDALRSLKKYIAGTLGPEWEVRLSADDDGAAFHRPFVRVRSTTPGTGMGFGPSAVENRQSYSVMAYPERGASAEEARLRAAQVEDRLFAAFNVGTYAPAQSRRTSSLTHRRAHPRRIPLWDYDGIPMTMTIEQAEAADGVARRARNDFMQVVSDPTLAVMTDPSDHLSITVVCDVRLSWMRSTHVPYDGQVVTDVPFRPR